MKRNTYKIVFPLFITAFLVLSFAFRDMFQHPEYAQISKIRSTSSPKAEKQAKEGRDEFFSRTYMDPVTKQIPQDAVKRDLLFAEKMKTKGLRKTTANDLFDWEFIGPNDVGGRTRALAVDIRNSNTILAGGASGGIWKSTDAGQTWEFKSDLTHVLSISYLVQDTRNGHEDTWYASTGEVRGNSASQFGASFYGAGLFKSVDNGETWQLLGGNNGNPTSWDFPLDFVSKVQVSPITGAVFVSSSAYGVFRSTDGGNSFSNVLASSSRFVEIDMASNGNIVAALSENTAASTQLVSGVHLSTDDGENWTDITPNDWPTGTGYRRTVIDFAPSNENVFYTLTEVSNSQGDHRIFKFDIAGNSATDLSAGVPAYTNGPFDSQGSYDLMIAVKPDDEDLVLIGGTSLYRTKDGFVTPLNDNSGYDSDPIDNGWIGGYDNDDGNGSAVNSHADIHSFAFDPNDPNIMWVGHDGGIKRTENIDGVYGVDYTATMWSLKNRGYNVTQVYNISIPKDAGDDRVLIGCQDNGTPYFKANQFLNPDVSSGDGSFCYFGEDFAYVSTQNGSLIQLGYAFGGAPSQIFGGGQSTHFAFMKPADASGQLFVNPFAIDPNDEDIMFYPGGNEMFRHRRLSTIEQGGSFASPVQTSWSKLNNLTVASEYKFSAMSFSRVEGEHRLYYAASDYVNGTGAPKIFRLDNSNAISLGDPIDISIPDITDFVWIKDIAINPTNSDEVIVVATNYNIVGLYHTTDAGATWTAIEGNLEDGPNAGDGYGPSLRSAVILPVGTTTRYLVGTSAGLYSTLYLDGDNTEWSQEAADIVGNVVCETMAFRTSDNFVAVGTHGRGVFTGTAKATVGVKQIEELPTSFALSQNYPNPFNPSTKIRYSVPLASNVSLKIFDINGQEVAELINEYQPAGTFEADWNGTNSFGKKVASGAYIYTLRAGDFVQTKKMVMLK